MSLKLKVNITKGWPNPQILEETLAPNTGVTIEAGMIGSKDPATGKWRLGLPGIAGDVPYIFLNDSGDPDANRGAHEAGALYVQIGWGGVHGISLTQPLEIQTTQFDSAQTFAVGDQVYVHTDGKLKRGVDSAGAKVAGSTNGAVIVGIVTVPSHTIGKSTFITFTTDLSKRLVPNS